MFKIVKYSLVLWGLSFLVAPVLAASSGLASPSFSVVSRVDGKLAKQQKLVALTLDADMTYGMQKLARDRRVASLYDREIIDLLAQKKVPATIFLTGLWIETYPEVVQALAAAPQFELGNHSYSHPAFKSPCYKLPLAKLSLADEISLTETLLAKYSTNHPRFFRFPGLCYQAADLKIVAAAGYRAIGADVVSGDAFNRNEPAVVKHTLSRVKLGSIILFHLQGGKYAPASARALKEIIPALQARGFKFVKVSELLAAES